MKKYLTLFFFFTLYSATRGEQWIRINQIGYLPNSVKIAVLISEEQINITDFKLVDAFTGKTVFHSKAVKSCGPENKMQATFRLNFTKFRQAGTYYLQAGSCCSPRFAVNNSVYDGTADFVLNYMRQQRCGFNPFLRDSCHQKDAFIVGESCKEGQHIDVRGGWHDATDCLQYTTTSANAIYQMMLAYEQNPEAFTDNFKTNGLPGKNGIPDIIDEIAWGMDWLNRMNPAKGEMFNQIADDRDHVGMRLPTKDRADYGRGPGNGRPAYFCTGKPQQQGKGMNMTTGVASTAGKFASDFALGARILRPFYPKLATKIEQKAIDAYDFGKEKPGFCQTVSVRSPYIYEEKNWVDDMELGATELFRLTKDKKYLNEAVQYGRLEPKTPWMGADTARHYQWYPFMNMGHYRIATFSQDKKIKKEFAKNLQKGIEAVWNKAKGTPFCYGIPSIWCSNNLTTAMLTQCILYRKLSGDCKYEEMEAALRDWLLGCNPWGVSMVIELPIGGNYPHQPHSLWVRNKLGNSTGGLVDGPVYTSIFSHLLGVNLNGAEVYERFQPSKIVYHDGEHDYSTNEPTMDGTACLTYPLSTYAEEGRKAASRKVDNNVYSMGGIVQGDPARKRIALVFTAAEWADGADTIISTLKKYHIQGGFFFTGEFYEKYPAIVRRLIENGHYVGSHSYGHLLYSPWEKRDSMIVSHEEFDNDMLKSYALMAKFNIQKEDAPYFIPPYEHYNRTIAAWAKQLGLQVIDYTPGTRSNADYTTPDMKGYIGSEDLLKYVLNYEEKKSLNGHFLMIHFGTHPNRKDKFYNKLPQLIETLKAKGYQFISVKKMIEG